MHLVDDEAHRGHLKLSESCVANKGLVASGLAHLLSLILGAKFLRLILVLLSDHIRDRIMEWLLSTFAKIDLPDLLRDLVEATRSVA